MEYSKIPTSKISGSGRLTVPGHGVFKVSGSGRISPELIKTSGSSKIPGGLKVGEVKISGSSTIEGDIETEYMKISGSSTIDGSLVCQDVEKSGSLKIRQNITCVRGDFSGSTRVEGSGKFEKNMRSSGSIMFGDDLESGGNIRFSGAMRVEGKVTAKSFEARLGRKESIIQDGIEAGYIDIKPGRDNWNDGHLVTKDIVGDEVILENVECDNVTGGKVTILPGCRIKGKIMYRESVKVDPGVRVESEPEKIE